jgi:hypothetical protein
MKDLIPLSIIVAVIVIWLSSNPWQNPEAPVMAKDIALAGIGGIVGWMVKPQTGGERIAALTEENEQLKRQISYMGQNYEHPDQ